MWYLFTLLGGYVTASLYYKRVSTSLVMPGQLSVWLGYALLAWAFIGVIASMGLERGIPAFLMTVSLTGPAALLLEYFLKDKWEQSIKLMAALALIAGVLSTLGDLL
ncbi:hypothetical protein [Kordiimonas pumila]|uniref:EamA domain-containing protein n=1 Tax=Kordiimonas pumila TaxID=2161677 RepID=A0ABV7D6D4_9PROT|nr:hypothetical protein [Kordiimonas pumila]